MNKVVTFYSRGSKMWIAYLENEKLERIGKGKYGETKEQAIFLLGVEYGRNQQAFARPLEELVDA